jgi:pimeloyl-ACP methyl ester carboxylesterase/DNA-binding CsgD family transcriptional regulator
VLLSDSGAWFTRHVKQQIRFCRSADGVRIAYAQHGQGPPLLKGAHWLTHLEFDWKSPVWRHWLEELGRDHTVYRYDDRGCGLSDHDTEDFSLESRVADLEAVVEASKLDRFALLGMSGSGAVTIAYSARHPERVTHLVVYGGYTRGAAMRGDLQGLQEAEVLNSLIRVGWGKPNPAFRRVFANLFLPDGNEEQASWYEDLQRHTTSAETAVRLREARRTVDVADLAESVEVPTLVLHARNDAVVPFEEGRRVASLIRDSRFVPLDSRNHILLRDEPAWTAFVAEIREFLGPAGEPALGPSLDALSERELEIVELVARGLTNTEIAGQLTLSERTIERHLSNVYTKLGLVGKAARAGAAGIVSRSQRSNAGPRGKDKDG